MITKNIRLHLAAGLLCCGVAVALTSCTDTWNDHYDAVAEGVQEGSLWQAISQNPELSNFASVIKACGYDVPLASSQVFTVFAPTNANFTQAEAQALIAQYQAEKGAVADEDNTTIKEFLQNHIALYNHSVSSLSSDSVVMMNGKYMPLTHTSFGGRQLNSSTKNSLYENGVLFTIDQKVDYFPNVFEYIRKDSDLDSLASFLYNSKFYYREFQPDQSVPGGYENGRTVYLDSVFEQHNELFYTLGRINNEDSTYWMVAPTNAVWKQLIEEYDNYFNYKDRVLSTPKECDSIRYTNARLAIVQGTVFSRTTNTDAMLRDSAMSTNAILEYAYRRSAWGADSLCYYQYFKPYEAGGVFNATENVACSNGQIMKSSQWNIDKQQTFFRTRIIEAEGRTAVREKSKWFDLSKRDSVYSVNVTAQRVTQDNRFYYPLVSNHQYLECTPIAESEQISVVFNIPEVLSNIPYDIYLVMAPAAAGDTTAIESERLPTRVVCTLYQKNQDGSEKTYTAKNGRQVAGLELGTFETTPDSVDVFRLSPEEGITFDVCSYGLASETTDSQVRLMVKTDVSASEKRRGLLTRTMRIDCIILKPHVD